MQNSPAQNDPTPSTFEVSGEGYVHTIGNKDCQESWCGCWGYPRPCACGGLIHADFIDESDDDVILARKCDKCGTTTHSD